MSRWTIPGWARAPEEGERPVACRSCGETIMWVITLKTGKRAPINPDGESHFSTCPDADRWRKR